ncbi:hypothetical protein ACFL1N_10435 [Thermodesulfobacteriota bacterium]
MNIINNLRPYSRFALGLRGFLNNTLSWDLTRTELRKGLSERETNFLYFMELCIYDFPKSPYLHLLRFAGIEMEDIREMVGKDGLEYTLSTLHKEGVYLSFEEFKCLKPIKRGSMQISITPGDLDNPVLSRYFEVQTTGSSGAGIPVHIDLDFFKRETIYHILFLLAFDIKNRPMGLWRPLPPGFAGLSNALCHIKSGKQVEKWFAQNNISCRLRDLKYLLFKNYLVYGSRLGGIQFPIPEHTPLTRAIQVARWLHKKRDEGQPAWLDTTVSSGIRVCMAARDYGLDIEGTLFRFGGEPYTENKAQILSDRGCKAVCHYTMAEIGRIGLSCASSDRVDEVHILTDKIAVTQHDRLSDTGDAHEGKLTLTTLLPYCPKVMLNVEMNDSGKLIERDCGCLLQDYGYHQHLHTIRSHDKLTSEGMQFHGSAFYELAQEILPGCFGGYPSDYQFMGEPSALLPKVSIIIRPGVGQVDEAEVIATVLDHLKTYGGAHDMMTGYWRQAGTLRVIRREPHASFTGKVSPLYIPNEKDK